MSLGEDDLAAGSLFVELADANDLVDPRDEVVDGEAEHVDGRLHARRLYRRFKTSRAPAIAIAIFAAMFAFSSFVVGPAITGKDDATPPVSGQQGHEQHH